MPMLAVAAVFGACVLWAISFVATKVALVAFPPLVLVAVRMVMAAGCYGAWLAWRRPALPTAAQWRELAVLSLFGTGFHYGIQTLGLQFTTASNASLYAVTGPLTIAALGVAVLGERLTTRKVLGLGLAAVGVVTVMGPEEIMAFDWRSSVAGDLMVLVSIVLWGLFTVYGKRLTGELGSVAVIAWVTLIGGAWFIPVGVWEGWVRDFSLAEADLAGWTAAAFLGVGCSFLATLLYFVALRRGSSQAVGAFLYTIPPMTAVIASLWLGERLGWWFVVGSILVVSGVVLTERAQAALSADRT